MNELFASLDPDFEISGKSKKNFRKRIFVMLIIPQPILPPTTFMAKVRNTELVFRSRDQASMLQVWLMGLIFGTSWCDLFGTAKL